MKIRSFKSKFGRAKGTEDHQPGGKVRVIKTLNVKMCKVILLSPATFTHISLRKDWYRSPSRDIQRLLKFNYFFFFF